MQKESGFLSKALGWLGRHPNVVRSMTAGGNAAVWDSLYHAGDYKAEAFDRWRVGQIGLNALVGALAGGKFVPGSANALKGMKTLLLTPTKDLLMYGGTLAAKAPGLWDETNKAMSAEAAALAEKAKIEAGKTDILRDLTVGAGIGGLGALGIGALALYKYLNSKDAEEKGKLKLKLPGSPEDPNSSAEFEMPVDVPEISNAMIEDIGRGVRRQTRKNIKANTRKQDPFSKKLIPLPMWEDRYGEEPLIDEEDEWRADIEKKLGKKVKYAAAMPPGPPGPPPPGPNQPPPGPPTLTAPTPKGMTPMRQPVGITPGPSLSARYTQGWSPIASLKRMSRDLHVKTENSAKR